MEKTLKEKVRNAGIGTLLTLELILGSVACNSIQPKKQEKTLEYHTFYGKEYLLKKIKGIPGKTLPFIYHLLSDNKNKKDKSVINLNSGKVTIYSNDKEYAPKRVISKRNKYPIRGIELVGKTKKGIQGIKANKKFLNQLKNKKISSKFNGKIQMRNVLNRGIDTKNIFGKEYFYPYALRKEKNKLNHYLMEKKRTLIEIKHSCGNVSLIGEVYRPKLIK